MGFQRKFGQRMVVAHQSDGFGIADVIHNLDAFPRFVQSETMTVQYLRARRFRVGEWL